MGKSEFELIVETHYESYPEMELIDLFKLAYQNEFGPGHLINDEKSCITYLKNEYNKVKNSSSVKIEDIGNGLVRVYLNGLSLKQVDILGKLFIKAARSKVGSIESYKEKLHIIREMILDNRLNFSLEEFDEKFSSYDFEVHKPFSHSLRYNLKYFPSYRLILSSDIFLIK